MHRLKPVFTLVLAVVFMALPACTGGREAGIKVLVSPKGLTHNFWLTVKAGADSAGKELGVDVIWKGPTLETDIAGQIAIVEDYLNKHVDAIVLAACDAKALIPVVEEADRRGIPVITIDSGLDSDIPLSFVASDNVIAAGKAADVLAELIGYRGEVACIPFIPGAETSIWRETGFREALEKYPDITLAAVQYSQADVATGMAVTENILTAQPGLKGIFAANEAGAIGAAQAVAARNLQGKVKLVGFDASPNEIEALRSGVIQALIVQNPFAMGYLGVSSAVGALQGKPVEKRIDTGVTVITMDNFSEPQIQKVLYPLGKGR
ncbi:MAG: ABC transporter substrate-binding protein [Candidatus Glassbacteria bacterium]|nr:ABC transporter substrate-binding protein [Candidatus Glassbacteria bacterium]